MTPFRPLDWNALLAAFEAGLWADGGGYGASPPKHPLGGVGRNDRRRAGRLPEDDNPEQQRAVRLLEDTRDLGDGDVHP